MHNYMDNIDDDQAFKQDVKDAIDQQAMEALNVLKQEIAVEMLKAEED